MRIFVLVVCVAAVAELAAAVAPGASEVSHVTNPSATVTVRAKEAGKRRLIVRFVSFEFGHGFMTGSPSP
jgi:hypothetical protein